MLLMKEQITRKKINLPKLFFVNNVRGGGGVPAAHCNILSGYNKKKNSKDIFSS